MKPVLCLGDVCPDILLPYGEAKAVMEAAARGEAVDAPQRGASIQPGGSVGNTAAGMARLGTPVLFAGTAGDDSLGRMLRDDLAREGVDVSLLRLDPQIATIMILVVVEADGGRVPFALPPSGASHLQLVPEQLPGDLPRRISWAHTTGMNLTEEPAAAATLDFLAACKAAGVPVSLDINSRIESMGNPRFLENLRRAADCCTVLLGSGPDELMPLAGADSPEAGGGLPHGRRGRHRLRRRGQLAPGRLSGGGGRHHRRRGRLQQRVPGRRLAGPCPPGGQPLGLRRRQRLHVRPRGPGLSHPAQAAGPAGPRVTLSKRERLRRSLFLCLAMDR